MQATLQLGLYDPDEPDEVLEWIGTPAEATPEGRCHLLEAVAEYERMTAGHRATGFALGIFHR